MVVRVVPVIFGGRVGIEKLGFGRAEPMLSHKGAYIHPAALSDVIQLHWRLELSDCGRTLACCSLDTKISVNIVIVYLSLIANRKRCSLEVTSISSICLAELPLLCTRTSLNIATPLADTKAVVCVEHSVAVVV
jgi:hypothetical protein